MHELHCSKLNNQKKQSDNNIPTASANKVGATAIKPTVKSDKIKKNPIENAKTDDFDELLEMFQKSNNVCNFKGNQFLIEEFIEEKI